MLLPPLIPTLTGWMLALLATLLAAATLLHMRRRRG
ncbi:MAG: IPTL-CTERM sorting domain-containing protein [Betaproteobacteria bacterium]|nr:IPTL-CTERM sorting domain-containing protein [Betaproteobacteria bacterium]